MGEKEREEKGMEKKEKWGREVEGRGEGRERGRMMAPQLPSRGRKVWWPSDLHPSEFP